MKLFQKTKKKTGSKVVVGGKKTSNKKTRKSFLKIGYFSVLALLLFSAVGDVGYNYLQANQLKAHAENWGTISIVSGGIYKYPDDGHGPVTKINPVSTAGFKVSVCKESVYVRGPVWKIRVLMTRPATSSKLQANAQLISYTGPGLHDNSNTYSSSWWLGVVTEVDSYISQTQYPSARIRADYVGDQFLNYYKDIIWSDVLISYIPVC